MSKTVEVKGIEIDRTESDNTIDPALKFTDIETEITKALDELSIEIGELETRLRPCLFGFKLDPETREVNKESSSYLMGTLGDIWLRVSLATRQIKAIKEASDF